MPTLTQEPPPKTKTLLKLSEEDKKHWSDRFFHSGFFLAALLFHLIIFLMVATWIIFPAYKAPVDEFTQTYLPPSSPPPPPPPTQAVVVPTHTVAPPTPTITTSSPTPTFNIPLPDFTHTTTPDNVQQKLTAPVPKTPNNLNVRLPGIFKTVQGWGRDPNNIRDSNSDPRNIVAKFPVYLASYAAGDWYCNTRLVDNKIDSGSLPNLVAKINDWSRGKITGSVIPVPLSIGGPDLLEKKPPFIFFTGHKDFVLTDAEIQNLRDYLQVGGAIWGDNALAGRGSRFDVAFRREMKRVIPDPDKNFVPYEMTDEIFTKSWYQISNLPTGMNYYAEPIEHLDIDGKLAILYTPNDYSDMMQMRILPPDDTTFFLWEENLPPGTLSTPRDMFYKSNIFYRNFNLKSCLAVQQLGMNIVGYLLVRFDKDLLLTP
jgi:hypothetical protein